MQLCVHAIGDRANREVLNIYEAAFKKNNGTARTCAGAWSTRSTSTPPTFRASASSA